MATDESLPLPPPPPSSPSHSPQVLPTPEDIKAGDGDEALQTDRPLRYANGGDPASRMPVRYACSSQNRSGAASIHDVSPARPWWADTTVAPLLEKMRGGKTLGNGGAAAAAAAGDPDDDGTLYGLAQVLSNSSLGSLFTPPLFHESELVRGRPPDAARAYGGIHLPKDIKVNKVRRGE